MDPSYFERENSRSHLRPKNLDHCYLKPEKLDQSYFEQEKSESLIFGS